MSPTPGCGAKSGSTPSRKPPKRPKLPLLCRFVTTKEIGDWAFQTFWWMPQARTGPFASDRPASVRAPFDNYLMCTAYSTVSPKGPDDALPICFNPYLETDLGATRPYAMDGKTPDPMAREEVKRIGVPLGAAIEVAP